MSSGAPVTQIDTTYLDGLKSTLQELQTEVEQQLHGLGTGGATPNTLSFIEPVDSSLKLAAGSASFDAGAALNKALAAMGGSVHDQLTWLDKVLGDMINEITNTVASFKGTESLNNEGVDKLISDFQSTISDINTPPGSPSSSNTPGK
ncbi:MAG TPA: hypothetical protein VGI74_26520 [Streptosporangiaceae bacterium]